MTKSMVAVLATCAAFLASASPLQQVPLAKVKTKSLNDTGLTICVLKGEIVSSACAGTGQDAEFGRDVTSATEADGRAGFSFVKVAANGTQLPAAATQWNCVKDNVTGLLWEVKTNDGGLRDSGHRYTFYGDQRAGDASAYVTAVNAQKLCGRGDWRLPTRTELQSLFDYGREGRSVTIDTTWFPNTAPTWTWASNPYVGDDQGRSWAADFDTAHLYFSKPKELNAVRLVRSAEPAVVPQFAPNGAEVLDQSTGLIWSRCAEGQVWDGADCNGFAYIFAWRDALSRAQLVAQETGVAWRLPNPKELASIVDTSQYAPTIDRTAFPGTPATWFWSSAFDEAGKKTAFFVNFFHGGSYDHDRHRLYAVRLVRTAP